MNINNSGQYNKYNGCYYSQPVPPLNPMSQINHYLNTTPVLTTSPQRQFDISMPNLSRVNVNHTELNDNKKESSQPTNITSTVSCNLPKRTPSGKVINLRGKRKTQTSLEKCKRRTNLKPSETANDLELKEDEEKKLRSKNLERNRLAAYKCRQRKKEWLDKLAHKAERMSKENEHLREMLLQLKEETIYLKTQLMMHEKTCEKKAYFPSLY